MYTLFLTIKICIRSNSDYLNWKKMVSHESHHFFKKTKTKIFRFLQSKKLTADKLNFNKYPKKLTCSPTQFMKQASHRVSASYEANLSSNVSK